VIEVPGRLVLRGRHNHGVTIILLPRTGGLLREALAGNQHQQGEGGGGDKFHDFLGYVLTGDD